MNISTKFKKDPQSSLSDNAFPGNCSAWPISGQELCDGPKNEPDGQTNRQVSPFL